MIISLSAKGQLGYFHCTATWNSTELMRLSDTPRTKENSAGSNFHFQVARGVTPVIRLQQSCFLQSNPHHSCCWNIFYVQPYSFPFFHALAVRQCSPQNEKTLSFSLLCFSLPQICFQTQNPRESTLLLMNKRFQCYSSSFPGLQHFPYKHMKG